jgi:hypothetical protein
MSKLTVTEETAFEVLIDASVRKRYTGDLNRFWDARDGGYVYVPLDVSNIRDLLTEIWGDLLSYEASEDAFFRLTEDGADLDEWPLAWCEEDDDEVQLATAD